MPFAIPGAAQNSGDDNQAGVDKKGNIFVTSKDGGRILMSNTRHCAMATFADDRQTVGCMVVPSTNGFPPPPFLQLEIYLRGGEERTIEPGAPILEWHFWEDGRKVAVHSGPRVREGTYTLYESTTARVIAKLTAPADEKTLPQWATRPAESEDEAAPTSSALREERTLWIAEVLRQIEKIEPGMRRKDLGGILTTEGGLSSRFEQTFVYVDCPYIKVTVKFKTASGEMP